mmetsp:Transcript_19290/g.30806  ORF Transcript_19290/g.30806 Transcript_19290/m.30806 type:complete len:90 (-) Transcript_19290:25-294(-)
MTWLAAQVTSYRRRCTEAVVMTQAGLFIRLLGAASQHEDSADNGFHFSNSFPKMRFENVRCGELNVKVDQESLVAGWIDLVPSFAVESL